MKYAKLILKNILRNKLRTLLTISSLVVSVFLIVSLATVLTEFDRGGQEASPLRLVSRHAMSNMLTGSPHRCAAEAHRTRRSDSMRG